MKKTEDEIIESESKVNIDNDDAKFALEQANHWIESADTKTGIALSLVSITFTIYAGFLLGKGIFGLPPEYVPWIIASAMLSFFLFAVSIFCYIRVLSPRLTKPKDRKNPFYYGEVNRYEDVGLFVTAFIKPGDLNEQRKSIWESVFYNSRIAWRKMLYFKIGIIVTGLFFAASLLTIILALFA